MEITIGATEFLMLVLGLFLGAAAMYYLHPALRKSRRARRSIDELQRDLQRQQADAAEHFAETAELLNRMTASYRELHNHLAKGANKLCGDTATRHLLARNPVRELEYSEPEVDAETLATLDLRPPLDYAPKVDPEAPGQLSEGYGIEKNNA